MLRYMCHCMNVSVETSLPSTSNNLLSSARKRDRLLKSIETLLVTTSSTENEITSQRQIDFVNTYFQNSTFCFDEYSKDCPDLTAIDQSEFISSFLKIKFPLLIGYSVQKTALETVGEISFKLNKCLICNTVTHIIAVTRRENSASHITLNSDITSSNTNSHNLSHSAANLLETSESTDTNCYNIYLLVNTDQMKMENIVDGFKKSDNYSHVYDLILDSSSSCSINDNDHIFGLDFQIKMESEIVKKVFLNRIEDAYVQQHNNSDSKSQNQSNEEAFKLKFLDLVNSLLGNGNENLASTITDETVAPKKKTNELNKKLKNTRRLRRYDNENILSSSVFEMEELEGDSNEHFLSDEDDDYASNEEETTTTTTNEDASNQLIGYYINNVLKKRNSNVDDGHQNQLNSVKMPISATRKYNKDLVNNNKYSCSLPRDIPVMLVGGGRLSTLKSSIVNQQSSEEENRADNENHYYPINSGEKLDHQKRLKSRNNMTISRNNNSHLHAMSASDTNQKENDEDDSESSPISNDLYEGDDELFEDDHNNNVTKQERLGDHNDDDEDDETTTKDMGQAISNLASSIVIKDGRELFGGVPSRRVPINSISKSCFE